MSDGLVPPCQRPQDVGQAKSGAHVRPGFEQAPEMTGGLLECLGPERSFPGGDALLEKSQSLFAATRLLGQEHIGVRAIRAKRQRLLSQLNAALLIGFLKRLLDASLRSLQRRVGCAPS